MSHGARMLPATLLALLALALMPASAAAKHDSPKYKLIYEGSGSYSVDLLSPEGLRGHVGADFNWHIAYRAVPLSHRIMEWRWGKFGGSGEWSMSSEADGCSRTGSLALKGDGAALVDLERGSLELIVFPEEGDFSSTDPSGAGGPCDTADFWNQWVVGFSQVGASDQVDPLTSYFELPKAKLLKHQKKIVVQTQNATPTFPSLVPSSSCGFGGQTGECTQSFFWQGKVTIRRVK